MGNLEYDTRFVLSDDVFCMPFIVVARVAG